MLESLISCWAVAKPRGAVYVLMLNADGTVNRNALPAAIIEAKVGAGRLLVCTLDITHDMDRRIAARQLRQRIVFHYRMPGLKRAEIGAYLDHRLRVAGYHGGRVFSPFARRALYRHSGGMPRLVNILAHKAMLAAFGEGSQEVCLRHVRAAARDTEGARKVGLLLGGLA
mgnify:CR=1 FL=1